MKSIAAVAVLALVAVPVLAAPCTDTKGKGVTGKVVTCAPKGGTHLGEAAVDGNIRRDASGKCHLIKAAPGQTPGQTIACPK